MKHITTLLTVLLLSVTACNDNKPEPPPPPPPPPPPTTTTTTVEPEPPPDPADIYYPVMTENDLKEIRFLTKERGRTSSSAYPFHNDSWWRIMGGDRVEPIKDGIVNQVVIWLQRNANAALKCGAFPWGTEFGKTRAQAERDHATMCWILRQRAHFYENLQTRHPNYPGLSKARIENVRDRWWKAVAQPRVWKVRPEDPVGDLNIYDGLRHVIASVGCAYQYEDCK